MTKEELVTLLRDPAMKGHRGSIVYNLRDHDCSDIVPELIEGIISGSYEEAEHGLEILDDLDTIPAYEQLAERLKDAYAAEPVEWRRDAIFKALGIMFFQEQATSLASD